MAADQILAGFFFQAKMVDEGKARLFGEDETCEKNVSESEDDSEEYISAPIGKITVVFLE